MSNGNEGSSRQVSAGLIGLGVLAVLLAIFIFQNTDDQTVKLYFWDVTAPMWIVLLVTALVALVMSELFTLVRRRRRR